MDMGEVPVQGGPPLGSDVAKFYGIPGLLDLRDELPWYDGGGPFLRDSLQSKHKIVFHYNGPPMNLDLGDVENTRRVALYHIQRNWGSGFPEIRGNGIQYHFMIDRTGLVYLTRTAEYWAWHATAEEFNRKAIAVFIPVGNGQLPSAEQFAGMRRFADLWLRNRGGDRNDVYGHGDVVGSECPGGFIRRWIAEYKGLGGLEMADVRYFADTGHAIGGAFLKHWQETGGMLTHGYPLTDEFTIKDESGDRGQRTVQVFERSVFEWHPEKSEPWKVLQRRLGAAVRDELLAQEIENPK